MKPKTTILAGLARLDILASFANTARAENNLKVAGETTVPVLKAYR